MNMENLIIKNLSMESFNMENLSFEESMDKLDEITKAMEDISISLEDSLNLYKQGVKIAALCKKQLDAAEEEVLLLTKDALLENMEDMEQDE